MAQVFSVDYKNDRFTAVHSSGFGTRDPMESVASSIAKHIYWMEHEYRDKSILNI